MNDNVILKVENLQVSFHTYAGEVKAVRGIDFDLHKGETLAIVGESGCGKTVTAKAIMRILKEPPAETKKDSKILFDGQDVLGFSKERLREYKGSDVSMIFQDPMTSLNPTMRIGSQIEESLKIHTKLSKEERKNEVISLLGKVGIPEPARRAKQYPHELSGGMRQRVMIAISLACHPRVLIADEPTTALDVTIQAQIFDLLKHLKEEMETSIMLITHDLGVVADFADRILVLYGGEVVETGTIQEIYKNPQHPYTWALLKSVPKIHTEKKDELYSLGGTPPDLIMDIPGCPFTDRCDKAMEICRGHKPPLTQFSNTHYAKCWLHHPDCPEEFKGRV